MAYRVKIGQSVRAQIGTLTAGQRKVLIEAVEQYLARQPFSAPLTLLSGKSEMAFGHLTSAVRACTPVLGHRSRLRGGISLSCRAPPPRGRNWPK